MYQLKCIFSVLLIGFIVKLACGKETKSLWVEPMQEKELAKTREPQNLVVTTWAFLEAGQAAWDILTKKNGTPTQAVLEGCSYCENAQCDYTVGFGGSPDEKGETTLDAMFIDGDNMNIGAVGGLRKIKNAVAVARAVALHTNHTILVGQAATDFAVQMGFTEESLSTNQSEHIWRDWLKNDCQPNFWKNVAPSPWISCGPYKPLRGYIRQRCTSSFPNRKCTLKRCCAHISTPKYNQESSEYTHYSINNHDTIGQIVMNVSGSIAVGTSSNGAQFKIPGRMGDASIPGAGGYADKNIGAAVATGDGDIMMRFAPSALIVERMRSMSPDKATTSVINQIRKIFPTFKGAVLALNKKGQYSAACSGIQKFPFSVAKTSFGGVKLHYVRCVDSIE